MEDRRMSRRARLWRNQKKGKAESKDWNMGILSDSGGGESEGKRLANFTAWKIQVRIEGLCV